ncbi:hypothetical protein [Micromonospora sp. RP3T]|uniref:hypothetical protein n=1 Tax=Micromonospora sp. RP3T TaxID=2135446 RepID=UPI003D73997F
MTQYTMERLVEQAAQRDLSLPCIICHEAPGGRIPCPAHLIPGETEVELLTGLRWCFNCDLREDADDTTIICPCWG